MYTDIKTFEDACKALNINPTVLPDVSMLPQDEQAHMLASYKLSVIVKAANEGWKPNWNDYNEYKYFPYFDMDNGFSFDHVTCRYSRTIVGSRLCFRSRELAKEIALQFIDLYRDILVISA